MVLFLDDSRMRLFKKEKPVKKPKPPPETVAELIDRLTTGGEAGLNQTFLDDLISRVR